MSLNYPTIFQKPRDWSQSLATTAEQATISWIPLTSANLWVCSVKRIRTFGKRGAYPRTLLSLLWVITQHDRHLYGKTERAFSWKQLIKLHIVEKVMKSYEIKLFFNILVLFSIFAQWQNLFVHQHTKKIT